MKIKRKIFIISSLIGAFALFTPWNTYKASKWPTPATLNAEHTFLRSDSLHVVAKAYTPEESKKYLNRDLIAKGYQPIQITIQNNSANEFSLSSGSVDLPSAEPSKIATKMMHSAIPRSIAFRVASLVFWPFIFPSTIDTIATIKSYKILKNDLQSKLVKKEVVAPYSIYNSVVFVPVKEYKESFDVTLIELGSLKPKVVHIEGLERGKTIETSSDVIPVAPAEEIPAELPAAEDNAVETAE